MAWGKLGSTTASATTDEVSSGTITANKFLNNIYHVIKTGTANTRRRFNNDTGSNYASRSHVLNNEATQINQSSIFTHADTSGNGFGISYIVNISGEEKLMIGQEVSNGSNGAGTAPKTYEGVGKWTNTSAQITEVDLLNTDSGGFLTGSNLSVLGSEVTPASAIPALTNVQDNSIFVEKSTAKRYWRTPESTSAPTTHSQTTTNDVSGIDAVGSNPRGGWGQQVKTGHPLVGKSLKTLTVSTRFSSNIAGRTNRDMTVKVFAGLNSATIRGTSDAINTSTLTTAGTFYDTTFTFATPVLISADDCILVCIDGVTGTGGGWNAEIKSSPENTNQGYWVTFNSANYPPANAVQTNRSMTYTATYVTVTPATWTKDRQVTSGSAICAGGAVSSAAVTNAQTSSDYVWSNITAISTARQYTFGVGNASNFTIAGGYNGVNNSQTWNGSVWATEIALDTQRRDTTAIAGSYNDCIVANGRNTAGTLLNSSSTFNGTTWSAGVTAGTAREHPAGSGARDSMLVAGGYEASATSVLVDSYNGTAFATETAMPTAAYGQNMAASASDSAHITGGYSSTLYTGTYDGSSWTATTHYPVISQTHYFGGGGGSRDEHLCMGGYKADGGIVKYATTNIWDGTAWTAKSNLTEIKYGGAGDCTAR